MTELMIESVGARGDGIASDDNGPVYVPYTVPGDRVRVRLGGKRGEGRAAELLEVLSPGPGRTKPVCRHFGRCGGCALQHLADEPYADWNREQVTTALHRRGFMHVDVRPVVRTPPGGRRRADVALLLRRDGRAVVGYHERASHHVIDVTECPVLDPALVALLEPLRALSAEVLRPGKRASAVATVTDAGVDLLLDPGRALDLAAREALAAFAEETDLARLSARDTDAGFIDPVARRRPAIHRFAGVAVEPPPGGFLQASPAAEAALSTVAVETMAGAARILDLFSGCGTFTFPLADKAAVHAVDGDKDLIAALQSAADKAMRNTVTTEVRDLFRRPYLADELNRFDAVLFDPPRAGAKTQAAQLAASAVPVVVGVSCNPATFARDARLLADGGYRLTDVTPIDQFLWSPHVELVGIFRR